MGMWRNGKRNRLKICRSDDLMGSTPIIPTISTLSAENKQMTWTAIFKTSDDNAQFSTRVFYGIWDKGEAFEIAERELECKVLAIVAGDHTIHFNDSYQPA